MFSQRPFVSAAYKNFPYASPNPPSYYKLRYRVCQDSMACDNDEYLNFAGPNYLGVPPGTDAPRFADFIDPGLFKNPGNTVYKAPVQQIQPPGWPMENYDPPSGNPPTHRA